jgi:uncharacterized protein (TIGR03118 family)
MHGIANLGQVGVRRHQNARSLEETLKILKWSVIASTAALVSVFAISASAATAYTQTNLVSDLPGATITDTALINPWGMSHSGTSPFWVSDNGAHVVTLYNVDPVTNVPSKAALVVAIPGNGSVTGQVFSSVATSFNGDPFIFASEDGTVYGWRLGTTAETLKVGFTGDVYKGIAEATIGGDTYLYVANFGGGRIDVIPGTGAPALIGTFTDPALPAGYAPFNIQNLAGQLYVTYALQDATKHDDVPGAGHGFVDKFDLSGNFVGRLVSNGPLNSPWGLAIAPSGFGDLSNALLVGNFGDGTINAFSAADGTSLGTMHNSVGVQIVVPGLWGLLFGNGVSGGATNTLYFTAGIPGGGAIEDHGLFGSLTPIAGTAPSLASAVSRRTHGAAGTFDVPLSLSVPATVNHNPTTEPRQGPAQTIVFTFDKPIASATATITEGTATAATPTFIGNDVVVGLTGVTDQQYVTITLANVSSTDGGIGGSGAVRIGFLRGDVNQNRVVSVADLGLVNAQLAQLVTAANFLKDVNASGTLTVADKGLTNAALTKGLPAP